MKLLALALVSVLAIASKAQAGIYVEPYAGYSFGSAKTDLGTSVNNTTANAPVVGAVVGGEFNMLYIGGDASTTVNGTSTTSGVTNNFTSTNLWGVIGAQLPMIKLFAGYGFVNNLYVAGAGYTDATYSGGTHLKFGAGFHILPKIYLNAVYLMDSYSQYVQNGTTVSIPTTPGVQSVKENTIQVTLSIPLP